MASSEVTSKLPSFESIDPNFESACWSDAASWTQCIPSEAEFSSSRLKNTAGFWHFISGLLCPTACSFRRQVHGWESQP